MSYTFSAATGNASVTGYSGSSPIIKQIEDDSSPRTIIGISGLGYKTFSLTSLTLPTTVITISNNAYQYSTGITGPVNLSELTSLQSIGNNAFYSFNTLNGSLNLSGLTNLASIGNAAFAGCGGITGTLSLPSSLSTLGTFAFQNSGLTGDLDLSNLTKLTTINLNTFQNGKYSSLALPNSLTSIGNYAFQNCTALDGSLQLSSLTSLESIGTYSFQNCPQLDSITLPNSLTSIEIGVFSGCTGFTGQLDLSNLTQLENLYHSTFAYCNFSSLKLPVNLKTLGGFENCQNLTGDLDLSSLTQLTTLYQNAFYNCISYNGTLTLPTSLNSLGASGGAFYNCNFTGTLDLSNTAITTIPNGCFNNCNFNTLILPNNLTSIGDNAFSNCTLINGLLNLSSLTQLQSIGYQAFRGCSQIVSLTLPNSLTSLGGDSFFGCNSITGLLDLSSLTNLITIQSGAFQNTKFTSIILPSSLTSMEANSFNGNTILSSIYFQRGCTLQTTTFSTTSSTIVHSYEDTFTVGGVTGTFSPTVNPLSSFFSKWRLYGYPYPTVTSYFEQGVSSFTLNYHETKFYNFYAYSPVSKTNYVVTIDGVIVTSAFIQTYSSVTKMTTFLGIIPPNSLELYLDDKGPLYLDDTLSIIQNSVEVTDIDVNEPFTIEPDYSPYVAIFDGKAEALTEDQFNKCEFTIFENNVQIRGGILLTENLRLTPYFSESRMYYGSIIYSLEPPEPVQVQLVNANTGLPMGDPEDATGSYYVNNLPEGRYYLRIVNDNLSYDHTIISNICFVKGTIVKTDQGLIEIDKITNQTLNRKPITVTKTIHYDPYIVKVSAGAFGDNPTRDTYMSLKHHIMLEKPIMAKNLINGDTITEVPYDGEYLYNVLVDTHTTMRVHGMLVETLDPNSIVGLFYRAKLSPKQKNKMIRMINEDPDRAMNILKVSS